MPKACRRDVRTRRAIADRFDRLERRDLLTASTAIPHLQPAPVAESHIEAAHVAKPAHIVKAAHDPKPTHHAKVAATMRISRHGLPLDLKIIHPPTQGVGINWHNNGVGQVNYNPVPGAYTPIQLETAYGVNLLGLANQGQGVTIGIVDEFDDTAIVGDANAYSAEYKLPQFDGIGGDPTLSIYKDTTFGAVTSAAGTGVAIETSLDVEMAHAMAPKANILLVEVPASGNNNNVFAELLHGGQYASGQSINGAPVVVVSTSYGFGESKIGNANVVNLDSTYLASGASATVAQTFSTGDGSSPLFPATSPNVIGVGGTSLYLASARGRYSFETAWGGLAGAGAGGGGLSGNFAPPTFQSSDGVNYVKRAIPDISMNADPVTGVSVYDSLDANGGNPWTSVGGTSEASPLFAGVIALAQQDRIAQNLAILNSVGVNNVLYSAYMSANYPKYFHDITLGNNSEINSNGTTAVPGYKATTGYDLATGIGSPIANNLVILLAEPNANP